MSSVVKPTTPILTPPNLNSADGDHSGGVVPFGKTTFAERIGKSASGISSLRRNCSPRSNWWLPTASASTPIRLMIGGVGLSSNAFEIGGVAPPNESPPVSVSEPFRASLR